MSPAFNGGRLSSTVIMASFNTSMRERSPESMVPLLFSSTVEDIEPEVSRLNRMFAAPAALAEFR